MKILTIRQPWAHLIVAGTKEIENRSWQTRYRGPLLIQASARPDPAIAAIRRDVRERFGIEIPDVLSLGGIVGRVSLLDCLSRSESPWFEPGNFAWLLRDAHALPFVACGGRLGIWDAPPELIASLAV